MGRPKGSKNKKTLEREANGGKPVTSKKAAKAGKARTFKYVGASTAISEKNKKADAAVDALVRIADALEGLDLGKQFPKFLELLPMLVTETRAVFDKSRDEDDTPHACDGTHGDAPHANGKVDHAEAAK